MLKAFRLSHSRSRMARVWALALVLLALLAVSGCAIQSTQSQALRRPTPAPTTPPTGRGAGDTLVILNPDAPTILNPHLSSALKDLDVAHITYEPLASFDQSGKMVPILAAEIPTLENGELAADGKSVTWKLKQGVKWSDGQPFTADDVLFTFQYVTNPDVRAATAGLYTGIDSVQVVDPTTVKVNFKTPTPTWIATFVGPRGMILPRHVFADYNNANARSAPANTLPVGTGPYRVMPPGIKPQEVLILGSQMVKTNKIVFEPNPYFREPDKPYFSRVEWRGGGLPDEAARLVLQDGSVDFAYSLGQLDPTNLAALAENGKGQVLAYFGAYVERLSLNRTDPNKETSDGEASSTQFPHPFFSDKRVRQAFAYAIDRNRIAALYGPGGRPAFQNLVNPPDFKSPNVFYDYNPDKAKTLLDEAGWKDTNGDGIREKDGVKLRVVYEGAISTIVSRTQQVVKENLQAIGVDVILKSTDTSILYGPGATNPDSQYRFNADILEVGFINSSPATTSYMTNSTCARIPQKANNWSGLNLERWCNPQYDALLNQSNSELDPNKRAQLFIQMNDMQVEDVVMIPIVDVATVNGASKTLQGIVTTPWDSTTWMIKDWRRVTP